VEGWNVLRDSCSQRDSRGHSVVACGRFFASTYGLTGLILDDGRTLSRPSVVEIKRESGLFTEVSSGEQAVFFVKPC
jgi:hypothetical protein